MKKMFLSFSLLVFIFSLCEAQDTIFFKTGEKDAVTVVSFGKKTINFILEDTSYSVNESRISSIKYRNGVNYSYKDLEAKFDSANKITNAEMEKEDSADFRPIHISIGVGGSTIESEILGSDNIPNGELGPYFITQSPAYNGIIDYSFMRWLSFGVGIAYQSVTDNPSEELPSNFYNVNQSEVEKIVLYNYTARVLYHFLKHTGVDVYAGIRAGESTWKEQITTNSQDANAIIYKTIVPSSPTASVQVLAGFIVPVYHCIAVNAELGYGSPYVFEAGLTFLFKK